MASFTFCLFGLLCLTGLISCQFVKLGECPKVTTQENFDLDRYLGKWYEFRRYSNWFSLFSYCVTAEYTKLSETSVQVNNTGWKYLSNYYDIAIGEAVVQGEGKLGVRFSEYAPLGDYWVLSTDYTTYSIVWSCGESPNGPIQFKSQLLWILTRSPDGLSGEQLEMVLGILKGYDINVDIDKLKPSPQKNCPGRHYDVQM